MTNVWFALGLTVLAGLATGVGSALAFFAKRTNYRFLSVSTGFSAGVMLYVSFAKKGTGHHLGLNLLILRGHGFNSSPAPPGYVGRHEGRAADGALCGPARTAGLGLGICARGQ